jgi:hypothetical protein
MFKPTNNTDLVCVKPLEILSNLRNLQALIIKQLEIMALTYDIEKDIRFQQGN